MFEEAAYVRDRISDLKRVLTNLELTSSDFKTQDFILKCSGDLENRSKEIFFVLGGKLIKNDVINSDFHEKEIENDIDNIYFKGNLFGKPLYNVSKNFSPEDMDTMKLILNWVYHNNSHETLFKICKDTKTKDIVDFVIG